MVLLGKSRFVKGLKEGSGGGVDNLLLTMIEEVSA